MSDFSDRYRAAFERLGVALTPAHGTPEPELIAAERRLGITVPAALRQYFRIAGRETALNTAHNRLLQPADWELAGNKLIFLEENQSVVLWSAECSGNEDPQVFQGTPEGESWHPEHPTLSSFMEVMLHWQAVMGSAFPCLGMADVPENAQITLDQALFFVGEVNGLRAYTARQVALCFLPWDSSHRLFVAGPSEDVVRDVLHQAGQSWDSFDRL